MTDTGEYTVGMTHTPRRPTVLMEGRRGGTMGLGGGGGGRGGGGEGGEAEINCFSGIVL